SGALGATFVRVFTRSGHIRTALNGGDRPGIHGAILGWLGERYRGGIRLGFHQPVIVLPLHGRNPADLDWWFLATPGFDFVVVDVWNRVEIPRFATTSRWLLGFCRCLLFSLGGFDLGRWFGWQTLDKIG